MERQNVTLSVPRTLLKRAKALAASREKSLSELFREALEDKVRESSGYKSAMGRQMSLLKKGLDLGTNGKLQIQREDLHARR